MLTTKHTTEVFMVTAKLRCISVAKKGTIILVVDIESCTRRMIHENPDGGESSIIDPIIDTVCHPE